jgi:hypothetical protein
MTLLNVVGIALSIAVLVVWWKLSNRRTRAIYLAGLTPEERAAHLADERAEEAAKQLAKLERDRPISWQELKRAAVALVVLFVVLMAVSYLTGRL